MSAVPPNALFSALSFIGFILAATPLPWHTIRGRDTAWNTGTCLYMIWTSIGCLILFVNSIVWNNNVINWAPVWCDISSRYIIGASIGIPASSLRITRRLYYMISSRAITTGGNQRRREILIDLSIGLGLPLLVMALQYVVQGNRFNLIEEIGCFPATLDTIPTYFVIYMWPLLLGLISMIFAGLTFRRALQQKARLEKMLYTNCSISTGRYWRLMALCATEIIFTVPISIYSIVTNTITNPPTPYVSWAWVHYDFSAVDQFPSVVWRSVPPLAAGLEVTRWAFVLCAFAIFACFGWAEEARDYYRHVFWCIARRLGYSESVESLPSTKPQRPITFAGNPPLPLYADYKIKLKHSSMPIQARVEYHSFQSLTTVDVENLSDFVSTRQTGTNWTVSQNIESPTLDSESEDCRHLPHASWLDMPAAPAPVFTGGRRRSLSDLNPRPTQSI